MSEEKVIINEKVGTDLKKSDFYYDLPEVQNTTAVKKINTIATI